MKRADKNDRDTIVDILVKSFGDNKSVNYIIRQDAKKEQRLRSLIEYSYDVCNLFGDVFRPENKSGGALMVKPDLKEMLLKSFLLDVKFVFRCLGLSNIRKALSREAKIKSCHPAASIYYLWFIGVAPENQKKGVGTKLLREIIKQAGAENCTMCLKTSTLKNIPWYQSLGFTIYNELDFGCKLYFLKK